MLRLKADLHTHTADDPKDRVRYSAETLIDAAAQLNVNVLGIACHERLAHTRRLAAYASRRGILLVPGIELLVEGRHVVVLNPDEAQAAATTYAELQRLGSRDGVILAPHPFYPDPACLRGQLLKHIDLFDAIEYACVYVPGLNPNRKAAAVAERYGLPLIGTSDTHALPYCDSTFTWIEAEERSVAAVVDAIRHGRVEVQTRLRPFGQLAIMAGLYAWHGMHRCSAWVGRRLERSEANW